MKNWRIILVIAISAFFIWLALRQIKDWHQFFSSFREVNAWLLFPTLLGYFLVLVCRAWRWQYIMKSQLSVRFSTSLIGIFICYMANNILPLRAGELVRAFAVSRREKKDFSPIFASVVVERIFDSLVVLLLLSLTLLWIQIPAQEQTLNLVLRQGGKSALLLALALIILLYLLFYFREGMLKFLKILSQPFGSKFQEFCLREFNKFSQGLTILAKPHRLLIALLLSFLVWLVNLVPVWAVGMGFGVRLSFINSLFLVILGAFSASIPAAPGFWGTFHIICQKGMEFLGLMSPEQALSFAIILHSFYFFPTTIIGLILAWYEGYSLKELGQKAKEAERLKN